VRAQPSDQRLGRGRCQDVSRREGCAEYFLFVSEDSHTFVAVLDITSDYAYGARAVGGVIPANRFEDTTSVRDVFIFCSIATSSSRCTCWALAISLLLSQLVDGIVLRTNSYFDIQRSCITSDSNQSNHSCVPNERSQSPSIGSGQVDNISIARESSVDAVLRARAAVSRHKWYLFK